MLNEAPNNNDIKRVANNLFNEAPNSNDATRVGINVRLTAVGVQPPASHYGYQVICTSY